MFMSSFRWNHPNLLATGFKGGVRSLSLLGQNQAQWFQVPSWPQPHTHCVGKFWDLRFWNTAGLRTAASSTDRWVASLSRNVLIRAKSNYKKLSMETSMSTLSCRFWFKKPTNMYHLHPSRRLCWLSLKPSAPRRVKSIVQNEFWTCQIHSEVTCQPLSRSHILRANRGLPLLQSHNNPWRCFKAWTTLKRLTATTQSIWERPPISTPRRKGLAAKRDLWPRLSAAHPLLFFRVGVRLSHPYTHFERA